MCIMKSVIEQLIFNFKIISLGMSILQEIQYVYNLIYSNKFISIIIFSNCKLILFCGQFSFNFDVQIICIKMAKIVKIVKHKYNVFSLPTRGPYGNLVSEW
jgi:hypothetical protein